MSVAIGLDISALDPTFREHAGRGIGRYVGELNRFLRGVSGSAVTVGTFDHNSFGSMRACDTVIQRLPVARLTVRQQLVYPLALRGDVTRKFNVLHFPAHMDAPSWGVQKTIVTVLDLIPLIFQDLYSAGKSQWRFKLARWLELRAIRNASLILAISETTKRDVHRLLGIPEEKIIVTPLGIDDRFSSACLRDPEDVLRARYHIPPGRPIILYVGGIDPRKNWGLMLRATKEVVAHARARGVPPPVLVMAGKIQRDKEYPGLVALRDSLSLGEDVVFAGFVPDDDLFQMYAASACFFFPSRYEGFGLPPLEAMAAGVPVVSSNAPAMREFLDGYVDFVDPDDVAAAVVALQRVMEDSPQLRERRERGRIHARKFTWQRTGEATLRAYEQLAR